MFAGRLVFCGFAVDACLGVVLLEHLFSVSFAFVWVRDYSLWFRIGGFVVCVLVIIAGWWGFAVALSLLWAVLK